MCKVVRVRPRTYKRKKGSLQTSKTYSALTCVSEAEKRKVAQGKPGARTVDSREITVQIRILMNKKNVTLSNSDS